jgi:hypothetical protein
MFLEHLTFWLGQRSAEEVSFVILAHNIVLDHFGRVRCDLNDS